MQSSHHINDNNQNVEFTGNAVAYFKIWVVNIFLTILTLGIYSAWATVRTKKYFYQNTKFFNVEFDFHAKPTKILKGRVIAVVGYCVFIALSKVSPSAAIALMVLFYLSIPVLVVSTLKFRLFNTSYRGIRFAFDGKIKNAYIVYLLIPLATALTAGLAMPYLTYKSYQYWLSNVRYGNEKLVSDISLKIFYLIYAKLVAVLAAVVFAVILMQILTNGLVASLMNKQSLTLMPLVLLIGGWFILRPYLTTQISNHVYSNTKIGKIEFSCNFKFWNMFWLRVTNFLLIFVSVGLLLPFVKIRNARFYAERINAQSNGGLDEFVAGASQKTGATGNEISEIFGIDIPVI
jgi:uncharacterized membrane protein YjgN (DUF898 family)